MKFGKGFKTRLERRDKFLCYKQLHQPSTPAVVGRPTAVDDSGGGGGAESRHLVDLQHQEWFVGILKEELEKFNDFYVDKEEDFVIRLQVMELELKKLYDTVTSIYDEIFNLREREEEMQNLNTSTNSKMAGLGLVCLSVAGLQLWHLKAYFERKKLL